MSSRLARLAVDQRRWDVVHLLQQVRRGDMAQFRGRAEYLRIADEIKVKIREGLIRPEAKLPSEAEIMQQEGVSRTVARQAISRLREDGYAYSHQGKGSFAALPDAQT